MFIHLKIIFPIYTVCLKIQRKSETRWPFKYFYHDVSGPGNEKIQLTYKTLSQTIGTQRQ